MARVFLHGFAGLALLAAAACSGKGGSGQGGSDAGRLTIFATTELSGQLEPCGCTSDPLGDLSRWANLISAARGAGGAVLYVDGGSTLYTAAHPATGRVAQESMRAELLASVMKAPLAVAAIGLGPLDLAPETGGPRVPRMAANVTATPTLPIDPPRVVEAGGMRIGLFGVVAPSAVEVLGVTAGDPAAAAKDAVAALRKDGARFVIGLLHMTKADAKTLVRAVPGIDFAIVGQNAPDPQAGRAAPIGADKVGGTYLIEPAAKGQVVSRLELTARPGDGLADALGEGRIAPMQSEVTRLSADLATWKADPTADKAFVAEKEQELAALTTRLAALTKNKLEMPASGSYFTLTQVAVNKALPCDGALVAKKRSLDEAIGKANVAAAAGQRPPAPAEGAASYVGAAECVACHSKQVEFWNATRHSKAWETLEAVGKQFDLDCIGCHVTGWEQPGGASLAVNEPLRDVQCEVCHGPGSLHVDSMGQRRETLVKSPEADRCAKSCHTPEHSDTFAFEAYLRDVTGPGHGEARHKALGDGPSGQALRTAALEKAGRAIGKGCPK